MKKTINVSTEYKSTNIGRPGYTNSWDDTVKVTFSNPATIVSNRVIVNNKDEDFTREDFEKILRKISRPTSKFG